MWYLVYRESDGAAVSLGTEVADPLPEGLAICELGEELPRRIDWIPATRTWALPDPEPEPAPMAAAVEPATAPSPANHGR